MTARGGALRRRDLLKLAGAGALGTAAASPVAGQETASGPTVYIGSEDGSLYAVDADDGDLYAVDAITGNQEWAFTEPTGPIRSSPTVVASPDGDSVGSRVSLGTLGHNDTWAEQTTIGSSTAFDVEITGSNAPIPAGEELQVRVAISNGGNAQGTQEIAVDVGGTASATRSVTLGPGESTTEAFTADTARGDEGEITVQVDSEDDSDQQAVTIETAPAPAAFAVELVDVAGSVEAGGEVELTVEVTNTGEQSGTATVAADVESIGSESTDVSLDGGESREVTLSVPTASGDSGSYTVTVATDDDTASGPVEITAASTDDGSDTGGDGSAEDGGEAGGDGSADDGGEAGGDGSAGDGGGGDQPGGGTGGSGDDGVIFGLSTTETAIGGAVIAGLAYVGFRAYRNDEEPGGHPPSRRDRPPGGGEGGQRGGRSGQQGGRRQQGHDQQRGGQGQQPEDQGRRDRRDGDDGGE